MRGTALAVLVDTFGTVVHVSLPLPVGAVSAYRHRSQCIDEFKAGMRSHQVTKDLTRQFFVVVVVVVVVVVKVAVFLSVCNCRGFP